MKDQKAGGIIISYVNIVVNSLVNFFLIPFIIGVLTDESYSIYKVMQSFAAPLSMLTFGASTIVARAIAKYNATDSDDRIEKENTYALSIIVSGLFCFLIIAIGFVMSLSIPSIYGKNYSEDMITVAIRLFRIYMINTALHIFTEPLRGCVIGNEKFVFRYISQTIEYVLHFILVFLFLKLGYGVIALGMINLSVTIFIFLLYFVYGTFVLGEKPVLHSWDKKILLGMVSYSAAILLQAFTNQINNNMDNMILGAMITDKSIITMYSSALTIYSVYNSIIFVFAGVYLPEATKLITRGATGEQLTDFVIKPGRVQAIIAVAVCGCFSVVGKDFISLWIGSQYINTYYVTLMLIIPVSIPLVQSICVSIMDAKLKRIYRSIILVIMAVINFVLSIYLVKQIGFWGAAIGTMSSLLIGHGILMNIYYKKILKINVIRMFRGIFKGIFLSGVLSAALCMPLVVLLNHTLVCFIIKCLVFILVYAGFLLLFGLNQEEKSILRNKLKR